MTGLTIRPADRGDAEAVAAIYAPIVLETAISFEAEPPSATTMAERIEAALPVYPWLVAVSGDQVLGYVYAGEHSGRAAYRWSVNVTAYVAASARGEGVGRRLYGVLMSMLKAQGFHAAFAGITLPNPASVGLHEAAGFEPIGIYRQVGFKLGAWRDVGWWRLALTNDEAAPLEPKTFAELRQTAAFGDLLE